MTIDSLCSEGSAKASKFEKFADSMLFFPHALSGRGVKIIKKDENCVLDFDSGISGQDFWDKGYLVGLILFAPATIVMGIITLIGLGLKKIAVETSKESKARDCVVNNFLKLHTIIEIEKHVNKEISWEKKMINKKSTPEKERRKIEKKLQKNNKEIMEIFKRKRDLKNNLISSLQDYYGTKPVKVTAKVPSLLNSAIHVGDVNLAKKILENQEEDISEFPTPMHEIVSQENLEMIKFMLDKHGPSILYEKNRFDRVSKKQLSHIQATVLKSTSPEILSELLKHIQSPDEIIDLLNLVILSKRGWAEPPNVAALHSLLNRLKQLNGVEYMNSKKENTQKLIENILNEIQKSRYENRDYRTGCQDSLKILLENGVKVSPKILKNPNYIKILKRLKIIETDKKETFKTINAKYNNAFESS